MAGTRITTTGVLYINGQQVETTFNNLRRSTSQLERQLRNLTPGTRQFIETAEELRRVRQRFSEVRNEINDLTDSMDESRGFLNLFRNGILSFGETFKEVFTANLAERFFETIISKGRETVDELLKIADAMTDVEKTTGMALEQVKELWDSFDEMDTRTSKLDRLKIAEIGGRLGVPIAQMKDFVQEIDKAYVALGDSFEGGLEGVVDQLGKIKGLFDDTKELSYAEAVNKVGSALNTLAAKGTASEGNISQFALRMGTLPDALKPAIDKVLGLGAAFEESGIDAQIGSSGITNFLTTAGENIEGFAISMRMSTKEAKDLLNTKPEEFFLRFAQGMKGLSGTETAKVFESLKLNSLEVQKAVGAAANKTDEFRQAMKTASEEMDKATSLSDEFNKKNNSAPAIIDKIKNAFNDVFTTTNVINKFEWLVQVIGYLTGVTSDAGNGISVFKDRLNFVFKIMGVLIASIISYNAAMVVLALVTKNAAQQTLLYNVIQKAKVAWETIARASVLLYAAAKSVLTGNTIRATAAMRAFNTVTKMNMIGVLIAMITAAVVAYQMFSEQVDKAAEKQKTLNSINAESEKGIIAQKNELDRLMKTAKDETLSKEQRIAAIKKLNALSPQYLGNLTLENIKTQEAANAVKAYTEALLRNSRIKVLNKKLEEVQEKIVDEQNKPMKEIAQEGGNFFTNLLTPSYVKNLDQSAKKQFEIWRKKGGDDYAKEMMKNFGYVYDKRKKAITELTGDANNLAKEISDLEKITTNNETVVPTNIPVPDIKKEKKPAGANKDFFSDVKSSNDAALKAEEEYIKALQKLSEEKINIIEEEFQKLAQQEVTRRNIEEQNHDQEKKKIKNEIDDLKLQKDKLNKDFKTKEKSTAKDKQQFSDANKSIDAAIATKEEMLQKGGVLDQIAEQQEKTHQFNLKKIQEENNNKLLQKFIESEERKITLQRNNDEEEINKINTLAEAKLQLKNNEYLILTEAELKNVTKLEDAKKILREEADSRMMAAQLASIKAQKAVLEGMLSAKSLAPEAREALIKYLETLTVKAIELQGALKGKKTSNKDKVDEESESAKDKVDVLGFTAKEWEKAWDNLNTTEGKVRAVGMVFQAMSNAATMFAELQQKLGQRDLKNFEKQQDSKRKALLRQLNLGYINNEEYHNQLQLMESETANKQAEIEYKQAKAEKISKIFSAIGATALGIANSLAVGGPAGIALAAIVGALGAVQVAAIAAQPLPEKPSFAQGGFFEGYTGDSSYPADETGERPVGHVKLHRKEWVAPRWMTEHPVLSKRIRELEDIRINKKAPPSFAEGGFNENTTDGVVGNSKNTFSDPQLAYALTQFSNMMLLIQEKGFECYMVENAENGKLIKRSVKLFENIETRNARK